MIPNLRLGMIRRTIERLEVAGKLEVRSVKLGKLVRYVASECRVWIESGCRLLLS